MPGAQPRSLQASMGPEGAQEGVPYRRQGRSESHRSGLKILAVGPWASYFTSVPQILCDVQTIMPVLKSCQKSDKSCLSKLRQGPY